LTCEGCGTRVLVDLGPSGVEAVGGLRASVTYADEALLVWDCPACGRTQAEDLVG
jgi:DNA-directed RNA polymerase subunit RPC12/RpoP